MEIKVKNPLQFKEQLATLANCLDIHSPDLEKARSFIRELNSAKIIEG
jgi:hypothetical protein